MALFLKITRGSLQGEQFRLFNGLQIGRSEGHLKTHDPKASGLHAEVVKKGEEFFLKDSGSKNGIRVKGEKFLKIKLESGTEFQIGDTHFRVSGQLNATNDPDMSVKSIEDLSKKTSIRDSSKPKDPIPTPDSPPPIPAAADDGAVPLPEDNGENLQFDDSAGRYPFQNLNTAKSSPQDMEQVESLHLQQNSSELLKPEAEEELTRRVWSDILKDWALSLGAEVQDRPRGLAPLEPAVQLLFIQGLQAQTVWTLGYAPRRVGPKSLDLPVYEPGAPDPCFEILPSASGILYKTSHADKVLLNGRSVSSEVLKNGDRISIADSVIEVEFLK